MARTNNLTNFLTDVSAAIKQKTGDNTPIPASDFDTEILSIETAGNYQSKTLNVTQNGNYNLLPDQDYDAMSNVNISVNVPTGEDLETEISAQEEYIAQLEAIIDTKASGGSSEPNIFVQETEPEVKKGIWLKTNKTVEHYISDNNVFVGGTWAPDDISKYLPSNFSYNKATVVGNDIYLITIGYKYNIYTSTYTKISSAPYSTWSARTVTIGTDIYIFGGSSASERPYTYKYNTLTDTYTRLTDFPESYGFRYGGVAAVGTDIYVFGNDYYDASTQARYNYKYDTLTNTYTKMANIPYVFSISPVVVVGTDIYLLGGGGTSGSQTRYNYKYDTLTNTYARMTDIPYNFYWGAATLVGTDIYLLGGQGSTTNNYKYDTLTDTYTKMTDIPYSFYAGDAVTVGTDIYVLSGVNSQKVNRMFHLESKQYGLDNSIVIFNGGKYKTELFNSEFEANYKPKYDFIDAWFYTTEDGLITDIPSYYGDGTQWINFKNPPVEEVEE